VIVGWQGRTWGTFDSDVQVLGVAGLEDRVNRSQAITGATAGGVATPQFADVGAFVVELVVFADSDADMATKLADIYACTWGGEGTDEYPFDFTINGQDPLTVFARVANRSVPTDFTTKDRYRAAQILVAFEASDPMVYGAEVEHEYEATGETWSFTCDGWAPSERYQWVVPGPAATPRVTWSNGDVSAVVRLGTGSVNDGQNLNWNVTPHKLVSTVGGPTFNRYGDFDGGNVNVAPSLFRILPGAQTITFTAGYATTAVFRYRPAMP